MPRRPHNPAPQSTRAFAMGGWIMLLFVLLLGVCVWNAVLVWQQLPPTRNAYGAGVKLGVWLTPVIVPLVMLGLAWCVGKLVSLMFGKSDDAGNIGAAVVLLGALSLFGYGVYERSTAPAQTGATAQGAAPTPADPVEDANRLADKGRQQLQDMNDRSRKQMEELEARGRQQAEAAREASQRQLDALRNGRPVSPVAPPMPAPTPASQPNGTAPQATRPSVSPAVRAIIDDYAKDLGAQIDALLAQEAGIVPTMARTPGHDLTVIKARLTDAETLRTAAESLKKSFDAASDTLAAKIEATGVPSSEARSAVFTWANFEYKIATRGFAADAIMRLCDKAREEGEHLRDNFGKWTLDSKGEVKCADFQIKSKIQSARFFVKAEADRRTFIEDQLRGK